MQIEYKSNFLGLWPRFISKIIGNAILVIFAIIIVYLLVGAKMDTKVYYILFIIGFIAANIRLVKDNPTLWQNDVIIDFNEKSIYIKKKRANFENSVLDYRGMSYKFEEIDSYSIKHYESFYFNTYFLVKIYVNGKEVNLLSLSEAQKFTDLISLLKDQMNIPVR